MLYRRHAANLTPFEQLSMFLDRQSEPYDIVRLFEAAVLDGSPGNR